MRWLSPAIVAAASFMAACGVEVRDFAPGGTRTDSLGVAVWTVPAQDVAADMRLERIAGLAMPDTGWAVWPDGVAVDPVRNVIYVLDEDAPRVLVFDFEGRFAGEIGRKGHGPGEYDSPTALDVAANGDLKVMDPGSGFVHRWSSGHEYVDQVRMSLGYWGPGFAATSRGLLYTTAGDVASGTMIEALVSVTPSRADTLSTVESKWKPIEMPCGRVPVPEVFSLAVVWTATSDHVAVAAVPRYEVALHRADTLLAIFRRDIPPRRITSAEAEASVPSGPLQFLVEACGMTPAGVVRDAGFVSELSPVLHLTIDPVGRVWAARGVAEEIEAIDVFDQTNGFLGSIESSAFPVVFLDESRYIAIVETESGSVLEVWQAGAGD